MYSGANKYSPLVFSIGIFDCVLNRGLFSMNQQCEGASRQPAAPADKHQLGRTDVTSSKLGFRVDIHRAAASRKISRSTAQGQRSCHAVDAKFWLTE